MIDTRYSAANTFSVDANGTGTIGVNPSRVEQARTEIPPRYDHFVVIEARTVRG